MSEERILGFELRVIHNLIREVVRKTTPVKDKPPLTQLQAGIMGYLFRHREEPVYQKNIEEEFRISRATATNTLQVMEKNGKITRSCMDKDARLKRIRMTPEAVQDHIQVEAHMRMMDERMLAGIDQAEQDELFRLLELIRNNLEAMNEAGQPEEPGTEKGTKQDIEHDTEQKEDTTC